MIIPRGEKLEVFTQTKDGNQIRVGSAMIWRATFAKDDVVQSITIDLDVVPIDGKITIRPKN